MGSIIFLLYSHWYTYNIGKVRMKQEQQIVQQSNEIAEKKIIIENKNEIIQIKDFQRKVITQPINVVDKRVQLLELWFSKREDNNNQ